MLDVTSVGCIYDRELLAFIWYIFQLLNPTTEKLGTFLSGENSTEPKRDEVQTLHANQYVH